MLIPVFSDASIDLTPRLSQLCCQDETQNPQQIHILSYGRYLATRYGYVRPLNAPTAS